MFFLVFLALGIVFIAISCKSLRIKFTLALGITYVKKYCDNTLDQTQMNPQFVKLLDDVRTFESDLASTPSRYLCTEQCPCPPSTSSDNWLALYTSAGSYDAMYTSFAARANGKFRRNFTTTANLTEFRNAVANNRNPPLYVNSTSNFDNFYACYKSIEEKESAEIIKNPSYQRRMKTVDKSFETFARDFESNLNCNGICYPGLFYYFKSVKSGPPMKNCIDGVTVLFKDKPLAIGILLLVSFVLTVFAHINSYPICSCSKCCEAKKNEDTKDKADYHKKEDFNKKK